MTGRPLNIVQIVSPTTAGGLERVVESLAVGHDRRGHNVTVATVLFKTTTEHPFVEALTSNGVPVREIRTGSHAYLQERREVANVLRESRPDVVHSHGYRRDILHRPIAAKLGIPTVTTVHGPSKMGGLKGAFFEWAQRMNYRRFDAVVAVSKALHAETLADGVAEHRLHCIPNAWGGHPHLAPLTRAEARRALGIADDAMVLGWVGRLIPVKGADLFLEAVNELPEPRPLAAIIGYGPDEDQLRRRASELGLDHVVRFYPDIRDAGRYFAAFDTYVLSSRSEGLPIVILEAMAAGTPMVAANVGGVPEAIGEGEGWLVPTEDAGALATAITESLRDREDAAERALRAAERLETHYGLDAFLDRYERVYRSLAGIPDPGAGS